MANSTKATATIDELRAIVKDLAKSQKEIEKQVAEISKSIKEGQKELQYGNKETEKQLAEISKVLNEDNDNWGHFIKGLIEGDLDWLLKERAIKVFKTIPSGAAFKREDGTIKTKYDLIVLNETEVVIVEARTTLNNTKIDQIIKKLGQVRNNFPEYSDKKIYAGVAYMTSDIGSDKYAEEKGLFLIKAPGGPTNVSIIANAKNFTPKSF